MGTEISQQQIVDCSMDGRFRNYRNNGCKGGWPHYVYSHVKDHHISPSHHYPYHPDTANHGVHRGCAVNHGRMVNFRITKMEISTSSSVAHLIRKLQGNVLAIGVTSNNRDFLYYRGGVLTQCGVPNVKIDHAVALVGVRLYSQYNIAEWKVKNSWGRRWGENGYVRIDMHHNVCNVRAYYSFPIAEPA